MIGSISNQFMSDEKMDKYFAKMKEQNWHKDVAIGENRV